MGGLLGSQDAYSTGTEPNCETGQLALLTVIVPDTVANTAVHCFRAPEINSTIDYMEDKAVRTAFLEISKD